MVSAGKNLTNGLAEKGARCLPRILLLLGSSAVHFPRTY